jgi:hypothetical protein
MRLDTIGIRTERCYGDWIARFIRFHGLRHPRQMAEAELTTFPTRLVPRDNGRRQPESGAKDVLRQQIR